MPVTRKNRFKTLAKILGGFTTFLVLLLAVGIGLTWAPDRPVAELKAKWALPPSTFVEIAGMQVHLRDEGPKDDPTPIVLVHGTASSLHTWEGWAQALKSGRRVVRFDLPGFGLTGPAPDGNYTPANYVRFVTAVLDRLEIKRCILAGNSFGGWISWETALAQPGRVEKLILVDSSGYRLDSTSVPIGFRIAQIPVLNRLTAVSLPRGLVAASVRNVFGDPAKVTPALVDRYFDLTVREGNRHALVERFHQAPAGMNAHRIPELKVPTLILWGGRDRLIPPSHATHFQHDIAGSQVVLFDDLGHLPQEEDPNRTVAMAKRFLGST